MADDRGFNVPTTTTASATAAIPSGDGTVWTNVSNLLSSACNELCDGELIHGDNFSLFAAMSALEIMDPKMDSGMDNGRYNSVDEAIESGAAPVPLSFDKTMDVICILDIMDHLLACEATWHKGHSLAQTVFSCIYLMRLDRTSSHPLLHSFCRLVRATCNVVISVVSEARTHEEEDLFTIAYGLPLGGEKGDAFLSTLNAVEETLCRQMRACKSPAAKKMVVEGSWNADQEPLQTNPDLEEGFCRALLCRLRFRKHYYHLLMCMKKPQGRGFELARKHISSCLLELEQMQKSAEFLRSIGCLTRKDTVPVETTASGYHPIGFDANLNIRTSAPAPPRAIKTLSWDMALEYFKKLLHDLDVICSFSLDPLLENVLQFIVEFQKLQPDLVARAHLHVLLIQGGKLYGRDPVFFVMCKASALPESMKDLSIQKNEAVVQLGQCLINLLKILCTNVAWQRRKLGKVLQDWRVIYVQLEIAFREEFGEFSGISDENVCMKLARHILIWVEEQTYWIALRFLSLGFELELYSSNEYCMVYWYLYVILVKLAEKTHLKQLSAADSAAKRKGKKKRDSVMDTKDYRIPPAVMLLQCYICLAEGLAMMLAAIRNELKLFLHVGPFNTEYERFVQHFEHLQKACLPDHISYHSYKDYTAQARLSTLVTYNHFKDAQKIVKELKKSFANDPDKMAELRSIEQVTERNNIALNVINRVGALDSTLKISLEFTYHPIFAVAVVKRS
ncbi:N-alpha-acetyltransferase 35, NatC auxiliary subunit-like isoform X1 [Chenopodium quinoa]|uniref:N-alpha-acetyltransferase 35, NatC auxiliary subunit-like isoform X1 n=1 Tax=Chenopodium quinoa TaxID=63459 RepID=UPI000B78BAC8|nr:N-alpha-acetyltransferase 35, NatC auxiliary subunit-like isoform X1 [Chenopodium quinoa]